MNFWHFVSSAATYYVTVDGHHSKIPSAVKTIESLIGYFNLDPNRVLDVILEAFECLPQNVDFFVSLLRHHTHNKDTLCQVLGFKFKFYQKFAEEAAAVAAVDGELNDDATAVAAASSKTPDSLHRVAALLLQHDLVDLDSVYPHLLPDDAEIVESFKKEIADAKQYARKLNTVTLNKGDGGAAADEKKKEGSAGVDESRSSGAGGDKNEADLPPIVNTAAKDPSLVGAPMPPNASVGHLNHAANQKLGLIKALLEVGAWEPARVMLNRMPPKHATSYGPLADAFCALIHSAIEPLYEQHSGMASVLKSSSRAMLVSELPCPAELRIHSWQDYARVLLPMAQYLGMHMSRDPVLMVKMMRLSRCYVSDVMTPLAEEESGQPQVC